MGNNRRKAGMAGALLAAALGAPTAWGGYIEGTDGVANTLTGTAGNDVLIGRGQADVLSGGGGADLMDGGGGNDTLRAEGGDDEIFGAQGNDSLYGGEGNDLLHGGPGRDVIDGGPGLDTASYAFSDSAVTVVLGGPASGNSGGDAGGDSVSAVERLIGSDHGDTLTGSSANDTIEGGPGDGALSPMEGADHVAGGPGNDTVRYHGLTAAVTVDLSAGRGSGGHADGDTYEDVENASAGPSNDHLLGDAGANTLHGNGGNDTLEGRGGADVLDGGMGSDTASYASSPAAVLVDLDAGRLSGGDAAGDTLRGIENVRGSEHGDGIEGDRGANVLTGGAGDDVLQGGAGGDTLDGGAGTDTASYAGSSGAVRVSLDPATPPSGSHAVGDRLISIENLTGSGYADRLVGDGNDNVLSGGGGADALVGGEGVDTAAYDWSLDPVTVNLSDAGREVGGDAAGDSLTGIENLRGSRYDDRLTGDGGDNTLEGAGGADRLEGGDGVDTASYDGSNAGVAVSLAVTAAQTSSGHASGDVLSNIENLTGSDHNDRLTGDGGSNVLAGGAGADVLTGGDGEDLASYEASPEGVTVNLGIGTAQSSEGHAKGDRLAGIEGVVGSPHDDTITGSTNDNWLQGGAGDDVLLGTAGMNVLSPGPGADTVIGGSGIDVVDYRGSHSAVVVRLDLASDDGTETSGTGAGGDAEGDVYTSVEGAYGSAYNDVIIGPRVARSRQLKPHIYGGAGDDFIWGGPGWEKIEGGPGADVLYGGSDHDTLTYRHSDQGVNVNLATNEASGGHAEGDVISGFLWVSGSEYADTLATYFNGTIEGHGGADVIEQVPHPDGSKSHVWASYKDSPQAVTVDLSLTGAQSGGDAEGDTLVGIRHVRGSEHADTLRGTNEGDGLVGNDGNDTLYALGGNDNLSGGKGVDVLYCGPGKDTVYFYRSDVGVEVDLATGSHKHGYAEGDTIHDCESLAGSTHGDTFYGDSGGNDLWGNQGNDVLQGRGGNDSLWGGLGDDVFVIGTENAGAADVIRDFGRGDDKIDVRALGITTLSQVVRRAGTGGTTLDFGEKGGGTVFLKGVQATELVGTDFKFR